VGMRFPNNNGMISFITTNGTIAPITGIQPVADDVINDGVSRITEPTVNNEWLEEDVMGKMKDRVKITINEYIRGKFFDKCKFISAKKIQKWSNNQDALCWKICKDLNVKEHKYEEFWEEHATTINHILNCRRNDVGNLTKIEFLSK
jgi:hypothetical protein